MTAKSLISSILILTVFVGTITQQIGHPCKVRKTGAAGTCTKYYSCHDAIQDVQAKVNPTKCNLPNVTNVVCCPNNEVNSFTRISKRKCAEYSSYVYETISIIPLVANGQSMLVKKDKCAHKVLPLILGGTAASDNEFPHMALIGFGKTETVWTCGGTLISELFVLTAAHCERFGRKEVAYVRLGLTDKSSVNPDTYSVQRFIKHPSYTSAEQYNDIALIQLNSEVQFKPHIRPACLPEYVDEPSKKLIATGWGDTQFAGRDSDLLLKVTLEKFDYKTCQENYDGSDDFPNGINDTTQICAGSYEAKDTCQGDSGGPLQIFHHSRYCMYTVIGITSSGQPCGGEGVPGIYTKVSMFLNWIEDKVWKGM